MKYVDSAIKDTGVGDGWFKVVGAGYDPASSKWCTEILNANKGIMSFPIPTDLAGGYYLVRPELLSLHESDKSPPDPQFYVGCAQIFLESKGNKVPSQTVKIPGLVDITNPSVLFNIYEPKWPYHVPGPGVYTAGKSPAKTVRGVEKQTEGMLPGNVEMTNANWWGTKLDKYHTEDGCWNVSLLVELLPSLLVLRAPAKCHIRPAQYASLKPKPATTLRLQLDLPIVMYGRINVLESRRPATVATLLAPLASPGPRLRI